MSLHLRSSTVHDFWTALEIREIRHNTTNSYSYIIAIRFDLCLHHVLQIWLKMMKRARTSRGTDKGEKSAQENTREKFQQTYALKHVYNCCYTNARVLYLYIYIYIKELSYGKFSKWLNHILFFIVACSGIKRQRVSPTRI